MPLEGEYASLSIGLDVFTFKLVVLLQETRTMKTKWLGLLGCCLLSAVPGIAQTNADINAGLQFNFSPPGARSLGLGGAFSGLADDATASYANPAGLVKLSKTEISAEFRNWSYTTTYPSGGAFPNGRAFKDTNSSTSGLAFASVVIPAKDWAFSVFRHQPSSFEARLDAQGIGFGSATTTTSNRTGNVKLDLTDIGGAASYRFSESFSIGASLAYYDYNYSSLSADPTDNRQTAKGADHGTGGSFGILWAPERWSLGAVYHHVPEFQGHSEFLCGKGPFNPNDPCYGLADGTVITSLSGPTRFNVPDSLSVGAAFQPTSRLTLSFEYDRVKYSEISDNLTNTLKGANAKDFSIDDGNEFHLGAELRFPLAAERSLFVRAGGWRDPDHTLRYTGTDTRFQARFGTPKDREDENHYSFGLGFAYAQSFQIDAAADFSNPLDTVSVSAVYRF
jgi:long-chain fatty acid transport protein